MCVYVYVHVYVCAWFVCVYLWFVYMMHVYVCKCVYEYVCTYAYM